MPINARTGQYVPPNDPSLNNDNTLPDYTLPDRNDQIRIEDVVFTLPNESREPTTDEIFKHLQQQGLEQEAKLRQEISEHFRQQQLEQDAKRQQALSDMTERLRLSLSELRVSTLFNLAAPREEESKLTENLNPSQPK